MKTLLSLIVILISAVLSVAKPQFLMPKVCNLSGSSGIVIQQVDDDWNIVPFDCENIEVLVTDHAFNNNILPGQFHDCQYGVKSSRLNNVSVLGERPGIYEVVVKRFDEINNFKNVKVEWDETGCDVIGQTLEVNFDMSKRKSH